jgi:hypothetical protein
MSNDSGLGFHVGESSTSQEQVLQVLLDGAGESFTEAQVRELLGLPKSTTHRALSQLVDAGIASATAVGRTLLYAVDPVDPLVRHLKIARAIVRVRAAIAPVRDLVETAILYGSGSRGDDRAGSDLDLLVVTRDPDAVLSGLSGLGWLQPMAVTPSEHMAMLAEGGTFARAISEGVVVWRAS